VPTSETALARRPDRQDAGDAATWPRVRRRNALPTTDIDDGLIASAAISGEHSSPNAG
jgi:hypothetical protein